MNIAEIARRANVSTATVSRTINQSGPVKAATARKVWRVVAELNYYPNSHARAFVSGRSRLLGLIVSDITNPFFSELIRSFESRAAQQQYDLLITSTDYETNRMDDRKQ
jgi:LacI family transcriptional regulator